MCTARLPTVRVLVATARCQYWEVYPQYTYCPGIPTSPPTEWLTNICENIVDPVRLF